MNSPAARVTHLPRQGPSADARQASYYQRVLDQERVKVEEELTDAYMALAKHERGSDISWIRRLQRTIKAKETELATLDRLTGALRARFPTPGASP
jgi:hypothetical protein